MAGNEENLRLEEINQKMAELQGYVRKEFLGFAGMMQTSSPKKSMEEFHKQGLGELSEKQETDEPPDELKVAKKTQQVTEELVRGQTQTNEYLTRLVKANEEGAKDQERGIVGGLTKWASERADKYNALLGERHTIAGTILKTPERLMQLPNRLKETFGIKSNTNDLKKIEKVRTQHNKDEEFYDALRGHREELLKAPKTSQNEAALKKTEEQIEKLNVSILEQKLALAKMTQDSDLKRNKKSFEESFKGRSQEDINILKAQDLRHREKSFGVTEKRFSPNVESPKPGKVDVSNLNRTTITGQKSYPKSTLKMYDEDDVSPSNKKIGTPKSPFPKTELKMVDEDESSPTIIKNPLHQSSANLFSKMTSPLKKSKEDYDTSKEKSVRKSPFDQMKEKVSGTFSKIKDGFTSKENSKNIAGDGLLNSKVHISNSPPSNFGELVGGIYYRLGDILEKLKDGNSKKEDESKESPLPFGLGSIATALSKLGSGLGKTLLKIPSILGKIPGAISKIGGVLNKLGGLGKAGAIGSAAVAGLAIGEGLERLGKKTGIFDKNEASLGQIISHGGNAEKARLENMDENFRNQTRNDLKTKYKNKSDDEIEMLITKSFDRKRQVSPILQKPTLQKPTVSAPLKLNDEVDRVQNMDSQEKMIENSMFSAMKRYGQLDMQVNEPARARQHADAVVNAASQ